MAEKRPGGDRRKSSNRGGQRPGNGGGQGSKGRRRTNDGRSKSTRGGSGSGRSGQKPANRGTGQPRGQRSGDRRRDNQRTGGQGPTSDHRERQHEGRHGKGSQARSGQRRAFSVDGGASNLPKWLREEIQRVTHKDRQSATLELLSEAAADYADAQFRHAHKKLLKAKNLSSRASAIRELLGLTSYRLGNYEEGLRELRAFRRFTGDTTHMPVEMDCLRGLGRTADVGKTWELFLELGGHPATDAEARVVYGAFLLDEGRDREAWNVTKPKRVTKESKAFERRRWFVAARAALALGDVDTAERLAGAVREGDAEMAGLDELSAQIAAAAG